METGSVILSLMIVAASTWLVMLMVKLRHKLFVIIIIALILFGYLGFNLALEGHEADLTDFKGVAEASGIYFSWLGSAFGTAQTITSRVVENNSEDNPEN